MPYIFQNRRKELDSKTDFFSPLNCGELNYVITKTIHEYIKAHGLSYSVINEVIGVLECAKMEIYRTVAAPYENKKRRENGSVSGLDAISLEDIR